MTISSTNHVCTQKIGLGSTPVQLSPTLTHNFFFFFYILNQTVTRILITAHHFKENYEKSRFSDPNRSLNRKRERFKIFEIEPESNRNDVIINLIIN